MSPTDTSGPQGPRFRDLFRRPRKPKADARSGTEPAPPTATQQVMRLRLVEFEQLKVVDVMVPRAEIKAVEAGICLQDLLLYFAEVTHSRLPVYRDTLDDPVGFIHIKDLVSEIAKGRAGDSPAEGLLRDLLFVPPSMRLADLMLKMQATHIHIALVVDEFGGTDGLVTLEDLVEEIVGNIEDEHDEQEHMFLRRTPRGWEADARTEIGHFASASGFDLSLPEREDDIDTLGGVAVALAGKVPVRGEVLSHPSGMEIEIVEADSRRIRRLRVRTPEPESTAPPQE